MTEEIQAALNMLDASTYRLFGGEWRHPTGRKKVFSLPNGDGVTMMIGLILFGEKSLASLTLRHDGAREIEVHAIGQTGRGCQAWRLTQSSRPNYPRMIVVSSCTVGQELEISFDDLQEELRLAATVANTMALALPSYDVQDTYFPAERMDDLRAILKNPVHTFYFSGTQRYIEFLRAEMAQ